MTQTQTTDATTAIHTRAMLVSLSLTSWSARKYDKGATAELLAKHNAASGTARVNKQLLPAEAAAYKALTQLATAIRAGHYAQTLAWGDDGWRLLPVKQFAEYTQWYRGRKMAFQAAVAAFAAEYPAMLAAAPSWLNGLWRAEDYPPAAEMANKFTVGVEFSPVPASGDLRLDLSADQKSLIEQSITDRVEGATRVAMTDAWTRLHEVVSNMAGRLSDPKAIFRDTLIENAREVCDTLKRLNVTGDAQLEAMRARVEAELTVTAPDTLRDSPVARAQTAAKATAIMDAMSGLYGAPAAAGGAL